MNDAFTVLFTEKSEKDLSKLTNVIQNLVLKKIILLENNPRPSQCKYLVGNKIARFRLRVGDYRVLFDVIGSRKEILIIRAGQRKEIHC
ncbi:MAG TPA: type II toxin-antitoxin system RelE/ParE family toxin [Candidatus Woesebacteria bacterium]|nr:type II toxin-antitoxin system RelE/ParE family toxin [Candidatus Woesebacteria bacterium]